MRSLREHLDIKNTKIYLDMDETLCGFMESANAVFKKAGYPSWEHHYWDSHHDKGTELKWELINSTKNFWNSFPFLADGKKIWSYVSKYKPCILSALPDTGKDKAKKEKMIWLANNLGINNLDKVHLVSRKEKALFATRNGNPNILVDDYDKNCREFTAAGGISIQMTTAKEVILKLNKLGL